MHKDTKWAKQLIALQEEDGKWGFFHTLSSSSHIPITTEQALRRLERLGYTMEDACIQKAVSYMSDCLAGKKELPDRREKLHNWEIFTSLMLAAWIRRFTRENSEANLVAGQWATVVSHAFQGGAYCHKKYTFAYQKMFGEAPKGGRLIDFVNFYPLSLLWGSLDSGTEEAMLDYVLGKAHGIYYVYEGQVSSLPPIFKSKQASRYVAAIELLTNYRHAAQKLRFVEKWLNENRNENGKWDMGKMVNDKVYFPLSDDWRKKGVRETDCTERISNLLVALASGL